MSAGDTQRETMTAAMKTRPAHVPATELLDETHADDRCTAARPAVQRGVCPHCHQSIRLNLDGTMRRHVLPTKAVNALRAEVCDGSGIRPYVERTQMVTRAWDPVEEFTVTPSSRTYVVRVGDRCKVYGLGRAGAVGSGWTIIAAERHRDTGRINVTVLHTGGRSRIVESTRIVYQRSGKRAA